MNDFSCPETGCDVLQCSVVGVKVTRACRCIKHFHICVGFEPLMAKIWWWASLTRVMIPHSHLDTPPLTVHALQAIF